MFQESVQGLKGVPYLLEPEFRLPGHSRSDTSVGTVLKGGAVHMAVYTAEGGHEVALRRLKLGTL